VGAQYSDPLAKTLTVSATDLDTPLSSLKATAQGLPAGLALAPAGPGAWTVGGAVSAPLGAYPVTVTVDDGGQTDQTTFVVDVVAEDADVTGVGGSATNLTATVRDRADGASGDLTHARVTFLEGASTLCADLAVAAACAVDLAAGRHAVTARVTGRYTGAGGGDVTVSTPPAATLRPDLGLVRSRLRVKRGRVALKLRCSPSSLVAVPPRCTGTLRLRAARRTIGTGTFDIGSASGGTVRVRLSRWARRALQVRDVRTTLRVSVLNPGAPTASVDKRFALRRIR